MIHRVIRILALLSMLGLLMLGSVSIHAQTNPVIPTILPLTLFRDEDSLTLLITGTQPVNIADLGFEVRTPSGEVHTYLLNQFTTFAAVDLNNIRPPLCLRLQRDASRTTMPSSCPQDQTGILIHRVNPADIFWYDPSTNQNLVVTVISGITPQGRCSPDVAACTIKYTLPTATSTPTASPTDSIETVIAKALTETAAAYLTQTVVGRSLTEVSGQTATALFAPTATLFAAQTQTRAASLPTNTLVPTIDVQGTVAAAVGGTQTQAAFIQQQIDQAATQQAPTKTPFPTRIPSPTTAPIPTDIPIPTVIQATESLPSSTRGVIYGIQPNGDLLWYRHEGQDDGSFNWANGGTGLRIGEGWTDIRYIFGGTDGVIYTVMNNGDLLWYRNFGYDNGTPQWQGPIGISNGWDQFTHVFYGGNNVIYAIQPNGDLLWYRHDGWADGTFSWANGGTALRVGEGWTDIRYIFGGTDGVIYSVMNNGDLLWYRNFGYNDGTANWQGPIGISNGWDQFANVFYGGNNVIYAVQTNSDLLWYRHDGWADGTFNWGNGGIALTVGKGWTGFAFAFKG